MAARDPLPVELVGVAFRARDALALGVSPGRLRSTDLRAPFSGARMPGAGEADLRMLCAALQTVLPEDSAFVGPTAAALHGMPLPRRSSRDGRLHVSSTGGRRAPRHRGTVGSRRPSWWSVEQEDGLRVVGPVETWISLSPFLDLGDLTAIADFLIGPGEHGTPEFSRADLAEAVARAGPARGIRKLRTALTDAREGVRSRPETHLRRLIADVGPREPDVATPVRVATGRFLHPDLSWPEFRVAVEYDGAGHRDASQHAIDVARHEELVDVGWSVLHVVGADLYGRPAVVIGRVRRRLRAAGWDSPAAEVTRYARFEP